VRGWLLAPGACSGVSELSAEVSGEARGGLEGCFFWIFYFCGVLLTHRVTARLL
jgi:hypothetical protein